MTYTSNELAYAFGVARPDHTNPKENNDMTNATAITVPTFTCAYVDEHDEPICEAPTTRLALCGDTTLPFCDEHMGIVCHDGAVNLVEYPQRAARCGYIDENNDRCPNDPEFVALDRAMTTTRVEPLFACERHIDFTLALSAIGITKVTTMLPDDPHEFEYCDDETCTHPACLAGMLDDEPTVTCPVHGEVEVISGYSTGGADPYGIDVAACGHHLICMGPGDPLSIVDCDDRRRRAFDASRVVVDDRPAVCGDSTCPHCYVERSRYEGHDLIVQFGAAVVLFLTGVDLRNCTCGWAPASACEVETHRLAADDDEGTSEVDEDAPCRCGQSHTIAEHGYEGDDDLDDDDDDDDENEVSTRDVAEAITEVLAYDGDVTDTVLADANVTTFNDAGVMTMNDGVVIDLPNGTQFQITIVCSRNSYHPAR